MSSCVYHVVSVSVIKSLLCLVYLLPIHEFGPSLRCIGTKGLHLRIHLKQTHIEDTFIAHRHKGEEMLLILEHYQMGYRGKVVIVNVNPRKEFCSYLM